LAIKALRGNPEAVAVLQQFRELFRASQEHFQHIEKTCSISGAQLWAMAELSATPGMKISELAASLSVHLSTASNLLGKLETKGLIRRERNKVDQRVVRVYITSTGDKLLRIAPRPVEGVIPHALTHMSASALAHLKRDLTELLRLARVHDPRAAMKPLSEL
jgi:DNA-binding MarR family transcriptional regulator